MNKQDIIDYVLKTPENTNSAILNQFLDEVGESGSGDFSTCTGTFICDNYAANGFRATVITISANSLKIVPVGYGESKTTNEELEVVLYKGHQIIETPCDKDSIVSISGNITEIATDGNPIYDVTGDFVIHFLTEIEK